MSHGPHAARRRRASVLILALWTLFFLSMLAVAVGASVSAGLRAAGMLTADSRAYWEARTGIQNRVAALLQDTNGWDSLDEAWARAPDEGPGGGGDVRWTVWHREWTASGVVVTNAGLADEERLFNLNEMDGPSLTELFKVAGGLQGMQAEALTDAVLAWRGDRQLTEAGDSAYYARPDASYRPHGARFQALAELQMVRGVTADLFEKVEPHLTLFGSGKVNVNTAGVVVLEILGRRWAGSPPVARDLAERIVESRKRGGVFRKAGAGDLVRAIDEVLKLTPEEASLLKSMSRSMQCGAACFGGGVTAWTGGAARSGSADVAFVYDRRQRRFVYWHER